MFVVHKKNGGSPALGGASSQAADSQEQVPVVVHGIARCDHPSARAKTRFLRFKIVSDQKGDDENRDREQIEDQSEPKAPFGQLLIVGGPGLGRTFALLGGENRIGREEGQEVQLSFGDSSVSRDGHATITQYGEFHGYVIRDGRKVNPVLLNGRIIRGDERLKDGDLIVIGETQLRLSVS